MEYSGRPFSSARVWKCVEYIDYTLFAAVLFYCSCSLSTKDVAKHATSEQLEELFALYDMRQWKKGIAFCIEPTLLYAVTIRLDLTIEIFILVPL